MPITKFLKIKQFVLLIFIRKIFKTKEISCYNINVVRALSTEDGLLKALKFKFGYVSVFSSIQEEVGNLHKKCHKVLTWYYLNG